MRVRLALARQLQLPQRPADAHASSQSRKRRLHSYYLMPMLMLTLLMPTPMLTLLMQTPWQLQLRLHQRLPASSLLVHALSARASSHR